MHRTILAATILLSCAVLASCSDNESRHVGEWIGVDGAGDKGGFRFRDDGALSMTVEGLTLHGAYVIDYTQQPITLDMYASFMGERLDLPAIVEFIDDDTMRMHAANPGSQTRPLGFDTARPKDMLILTRVD